MRIFLFLSLIILSFAPQVWATPKGKIVPRYPLNDRYVVLFIVDGSNADHFYSLIESDQLPHIRKLMWNQGVHFTHATTIFPSATTTGYHPYLTGLYPGHSGIPYLNWYNRETHHITDYLTSSGYNKLNIDYFDFYSILDPDQDGPSSNSSLFDHLIGHPTAAIYSLFSRNATIAEPMLPVAGLWSNFVSRRFQQIDQYAMNKMMRLYSQKIDQIPRLAIVGLLGNDIIGHEYGTTSAEVTFNLQIFDNMLARFVALLDKQGILDKTYIIIGSDHGMHDTHRLFEIEKEIERLGVPIRSSNPKATDFILQSSARGIGSAELALKSESGWSKPPTLDEWRHVVAGKDKKVDLIDFLRNHDAVDLIAVRNGLHRVDVFSKTGHGTIHAHQVASTFYYSYQPDHPESDPLKLPPSADPLFGRFLTAPEWIDAIENPVYPTAVPALSQIFHDGRSGDMVVIAKKEWSFRVRKKATHGTLLADDMRIPLIIRGPSISPASMKNGSSVDLYATICDWFGIPPKKGRDGDSLFSPAVHNPKEKAIHRSIAAMKHFLSGHPPLIKIIDRDSLKKSFLSAFPDHHSYLQPLLDELKRKNRIHKHLKRLIVSASDKNSFKKQKKRQKEDLLPVYNAQLNLIEHDILVLDDLIHIVQGKL